MYTNFTVLLCSLFLLNDVANIVLCSLLNFKIQFIQRKTVPKLVIGKYRQFAISVWNVIKIHCKRSDVTSLKKWRSRIIFAYPEFVFCEGSWFFSFFVFPSDFWFWICLDCWRYAILYSFLFLPHCISYNFVNYSRNVILKTPTTLGGPNDDIAQKSKKMNKSGVICFRWRNISVPKHAQQRPTQNMML